MNEKLVDSDEAEPTPRAIDLFIPIPNLTPSNPDPDL